MGLMVAANRRFAEFGDSVMVRGLGVQRATPVQTQKQQSGCGTFTVYSTTCSWDYPQHECLQSHFRSVTFLLSSHI